METVNSEGTKEFDLIYSSLELDEFNCTYEGVHVRRCDL